MTNADILSAFKRGLKVTLIHVRSTLGASILSAISQWSLQYRCQLEIASDITGACINLILVSMRITGAWAKYPRVSQRPWWAPAADLLRCWIQCPRCRRHPTAITITGITITIITATITITAIITVIITVTITVITIIITIQNNALTHLLLLTGSWWETELSWIEIWLNQNP